LRPRPPPGYGRSTVPGPLQRHASSPADLKRRLAAERAGEVFLVYRDGNHRQQILPLSGERLTVGRGPLSDLQITWDDEVSRTHAELQRVGGAWAVADDGLSTNGTFCNEERVRGRRRLRDGDQLRFGRTMVAIRTPGPGGAATTAMPGDSPDVTLSDTQRRVLAALCRPLLENPYATPATNQRIAQEVFLGVEAVKVHLRALYRKLAIADLPQNEKRARLVELALQRGLVHEQD
jgi:pSer/pThr/pTyr-binding forkhead associated (FHA) protein